MTRTRPFQLLIKPVGADCNLRCSYCFYLRTHEFYETRERHIMPDNVLEKCVAGLLSYRFQETIFAWQGGEPTLAGLDFFQHAIDLQKKHGASGQIVGNGFQTNGILIDEEWCRLFHDYQFLVGLSLDGPQEFHDRFRCDNAGRGTWTKVMAAAEVMNKWNVAHNILCVLNSDNIRMGVDLCRWFVNQGFRYLQFIPCLEPGMPQNVSPEAYGDFLCDTFDYWRTELVGRVSIRDFDSLLASYQNQPGALCTFGKTCDHYILIEHNGDVHPCDFFVHPDHKLGNVLEAPLDSFLASDKYRSFAYQKDKTAECRGCRWRAMCHGGCQKDRLAGGTLDARSVLCSAYKRFFAHANPKLRPLADRIGRATLRHDAAQDAPQRGKDSQP